MVGRDDEPRSVRPCPPTTSRLQLPNHTSPAAGRTFSSAPRVIAAVTASCTATPSADPGGGAIATSTAPIAPAASATAATSKTNATPTAPPSCMGGPAVTTAGRAIDGNRWQWGARDHEPSGGRRLGPGHRRPGPLCGSWDTEIPGMERGERETRQHRKDKRTATVSDADKAFTHVTTGTSAPPPTTTAAAMASTTPDPAAQPPWRLLGSPRPVPRNLRSDADRYPAPRDGGQRLRLGGATPHPTFPAWAIWNGHHESQSRRGRLQPRGPFALFLIGFPPSLHQSARDVYCGERED